MHTALNKEADMVSDAIHDLAQAVEKVLMKHGKDIIERQFHQERLANAAIDIFYSTATLSRATWAINRANNKADAQADIENAKIFVSMATRRTGRNIRALSRNQDGLLKDIAERALVSGQLTVPTPTDA